MNLIAGDMSITRIGRGINLIANCQQGSREDMYELGKQVREGIEHTEPSTFWNLEGGVKEASHSLLLS